MPKIRKYFIEIYYIYSYIIYIIKTKLWTFGNLKLIFTLLSNITYIGRFLLSCFISDIFPFSLSEFLAEDSQEKFWDFVEASQNIGSSDHHGKTETDASLTLVSGNIWEIWSLSEYGGMAINGKHFYL